MHYGPRTPLAQQLHAEKYRQPGESFREQCGRIAQALKDDDTSYRAFRSILLDQRFLPAGRVQAAVGTTKSVTPYNCFVSGVIEDSFVSGSGNIMQRATEAAVTMRQGGGIGYDFSRLRPRGEMIRKLQSSASGPVSFMSIYDAVCQCIASSGHRRGAQMGVLRIDHPDIEEFVLCKHQLGRLEGFNISVGITDKFMQCLQTGEPFPLVFEGRTYREINAKALWEQLMRSTWDWAEPGVLFLDTINRMNNLSYCENIEATNPCGEQPLPPYGACLLGSFNLTKYIYKGTEGWFFDWEQFREDIPVAVRAMDNIIDQAIYPLDEHEREAKNKRRMGLGVSGLANAAEAMGFHYGQEKFLFFTDELLGVLANECYRASAMLAKEKGAFPLFDRDMYMSSEYINGLDQDVRDLIAQHGTRNSHLTSIAPTGTISMTADNISSGIEPVFMHSYERTIQMPDGEKTVQVEDYGFANFGVRGRTAEMVTAKEHVAVLEVAARHMDSAVSKTCNVSPDMPWEDFKHIYTSAWEKGAKGCTTFNSGGKRMGILKATVEEEEEEAESCKLDLVTGRRECS